MFADSQHQIKFSHFWLSQLGHMSHNGMMSFPIPVLNNANLKMKKKKTLGVNDVVF